MYAEPHFAFEVFNRDSRFALVNTTRQVVLYTESGGTFPSLTSSTCRAASSCLKNCVLYVIK